MNFQPTICSECSYPPNFIVFSKKDHYSIKCRDCGDTWDEPAENFSDNSNSSDFSDNTLGGEDLDD